MIATLFDGRSCSAVAVLTRLARPRSPASGARAGDGTRRRGSDWDRKGERFLSPTLWSKGDRVSSTYAVASGGVSRRAGSPLRQRVGLCGRAATGRGLPLRPEIRPIARGRLAYQATVGDVNPHAQGSWDPTRLRGGRRLCGARIRCGALVASRARRQAGCSEPACHAATALRAIRPSSVRDPTSGPAREPLHSAREVEEVWCPQRGRQASPPLPVQAPGLGVGPKGFGHGTGPANFGFAAGLAVLEFDGHVDAHDPDGYTAAVGLAAAARLARPSACRDLGIRRLRERRRNHGCGGRP